MYQVIEEEGKNELDMRQALAVPGRRRTNIRLIAVLACAEIRSIAPIGWPPGT